MDAFGYLSVLLSIIIGLAITQLLSAAGRLIRGRASVRFDWLPIAWAVLLLVMAIQMWWSSFGLRSFEAWTFLTFFVVLLQTICFYMATALVLPESVAEPSDDEGGGDDTTPMTADLRAFYERQTPWFFGFLGATILVSALKEFVLTGHGLRGANLVFHLFMLFVCVAAVLVRRRALHATLAVLTLAAGTIYIAALFSTLR